MNILVTVNDNYVYPLKIMLGSLFRHNKEEEITVYLLHSDVSEKNRKTLDRMISYYGGKFVPIHVSEDLFADAPCPEYFSKEMYYRILAPWILPELNRVLYLDPDMVVLQDLSKFYQMDMNGFCYAGCKDRYGYSRLQRRDPGKWSDHIYINSGVLLCNLMELRYVTTKEEYLKYIEDHKDELEYPDQDVINFMNYNRIRYADEKYNLDPNNLHAWEYIAMIFKPLNFLCKPFIFHYMGGDKPWFRTYNRLGLKWYVQEEKQINPHIKNTRDEELSRARKRDMHHLLYFGYCAIRRIKRKVFKIDSDVFME